MKRVIFLDGEFLAAEPALEAHLAPVKLGCCGVFETMLSRGRKIYFLREHLKRLKRGAGYYRIKLPFPLKEIERYVQKVVNINKHKWGRVRLLVWKENGRVHIAATATAQTPLAKHKYFKGLSVKIARLRCHAGKQRANVKSIRYQPYMAAYQEAAAQSYDEAVLLNTRGELAEGSRTNLFFVERGRLYTPSLSCGCLDGITRQTVLSLAKKMNIPCREGRFPPGRLKAAEEAFLTNALFGIIPLRAVEKTTLPAKKDGSLVRKLRQAYNLRLSHS